MRWVDAFMDLSGQHSAWTLEQQRVLVKFMSSNFKPGRYTMLAAVPYNSGRMRIVKDDYYYNMWMTPESYLTEPKIALTDALEKFARFARVKAKVSKGRIDFLTKHQIMTDFSEAYLKPVLVSGRGEDRFIYEVVFREAVSQLETFTTEYIEHLRTRMGMKRSFEVPIPAHKSGGGNLDTFLSTKRGDTHVLEAVSLFPIPEHGVLSSLNWGIEVEAAGARGVTRPVGWVAKYDGSLESAYDDDADTRYYDARNAWEQEEPTEVYDHSDDDVHKEEIYDYETDEYVDNPDYVDPDDCQACIDYENYKDEYETWQNEEPNEDEFYSETEEDSREFVSPILHSFHSKGLESLLAELSTQPQNDTAGVHVHVDVQSLNVKQLGSLVFGYNMVENILVSSYRRNTREYCKLMETNHFRFTGQSVKALIRQNKVSNLTSVETYDRYVALNLEAIAAHGTVEFRAMGPVYEYEHLIRWASICREFVNVAKAGVKPKEWLAVKNAQDLLNLFIRKGKETGPNMLSPITVEDIDAIYDMNHTHNMFESNSDTRELVGTQGGEI